MAEDETRRDWDKVQENSTDITDRLRITLGLQHGYLYRTIVKKSGAIAMVFVVGD